MNSETQKAFLESLNAEMAKEKFVSPTQRNTSPVNQNHGKAILFELSPSFVFVRFGIQRFKKFHSNEKAINEIETSFEEEDKSICKCGADRMV